MLSNIRGDNVTSSERNYWNSLQYILEYFILLFAFSWYQFWCKYIGAISMTSQSIIYKRKYYSARTRLAYFPIIFGFVHIAFYALIYPRLLRTSNTVDYSSRYQQSITACVWVALSHLLCNFCLIKWRNATAMIGRSGDSLYSILLSCNITFILFYTEKILY